MIYGTDHVYGHMTFGYTTLCQGTKVMPLHIHVLTCTYMYMYVGAVIRGHFTVMFTIYMYTLGMMFSIAMCY